MAQESVNTISSENFAYWLQGYFEINGVTALTEAQASMIARHLALVFKHEIDPAVGGDAEELQAIHDGPPSHAGFASGSDIFHRPPGVRC